MTDQQWLKHVSEAMSQQYIDKRITVFVTGGTDYYTLQPKGVARTIIVCPTLPDYPTEPTFLENLGEEMFYWNVQDTSDRPIFVSRYNPNTKIPFDLDVRVIGENLETVPQLADNLIRETHYYNAPTKRWRKKR